MKKLLLLASLAASLWLCTTAHAQAQGNRSRFVMCVTVVDSTCQSPRPGFAPPPPPPPPHTCTINWGYWSSAGVALIPVQYANPIYATVGSPGSLAVPGSSQIGGGNWWSCASSNGGTCLFNGTAATPWQPAAGTYTCS